MRVIIVTYSFFFFFRGGNSNAGYRTVKELTSDVLEQLRMKYSSLFDDVTPNAIRQR